MFESLFAFLFKFRPALFGQGEVRLSPASTAYTAIVLTGVVVVVSVLTYRTITTKGGLRDRVVLVGLRLTALAVLLLCLFRPVLVLRAAVPQQNFVGILIDDSRSMRIADSNGQPRSAFVQEALGGPDAALYGALADRFALRFFRFSSSTARLASPADLTFEGTETRLGEALTRAREELAGLPLSALVVLTDGADTTEAPLTEPLLALTAQAIPVFTVGLGRESVQRDVQVSRVATPRAVLKGSTLVVDVVLSQTGYRDTTVPLNVESEGRIVSTQDVRLPADGEPATVRARFTVADAGAHTFRFRVPPQAGEEITQNNVRDVLIEVEDRRERILYFEGEPRFEFKFIRKAVEDDRNVEVVSLQRTADNKYLRIGVDNEEHLLAGFPKTREELFAYRGLILGSIEAGAFTGDQLRMIAEFVDRRGGGLLMLGGRRSFAEGGYAGTPVAEVLPMLIEASDAQAAGTPVAHIDARPTRAGSTHPVTQIGATEKESASRWAALPQVTSVNGARRLKPGATVLLSGLDEARRDRPVLVYHRYGRGKALALPVQDTLAWQLGASVAVDDMTHEYFWRQLLRWTADGAPGAITIRTSPERVEPGRPVTITADVVDQAFAEVNNARVVAHVTGPAGNQYVPMQWTGDRNGEYKATFVAPDAGVYETRVEASRDSIPLGEEVAFVRAAPSDDEYFDATMRAPLLQRVAADTGGRFYTRDTIGTLPEDLKYTGRGVTSVEERELWDMPAVLLALLGLTLGEWGYRRLRGLA